MAISPMIVTLAALPVLVAALYFLTLGLVAFLAPARASGFLMGFATSAATHYLELVIRLVVGGAFIVRSPQMLFSEVFALFGWVLVLTTVGLLFVPWQWHRRFAQESVPRALRYLKLVAAASLALGGFVLVSLLAGSRL